MFRVVTGEKIKRARARRRLSQAQLVSRANHAFSVPNLSGWERNVYKPSPANLQALLSALNVSYEEITEPYQEAMAQKA